MKQFMTIEMLKQGWTPVIYWLNEEEPDLGPFWEPYEKFSFGFGHDNKAAEHAARNWANDIGLLYVAPSTDMNTINTLFNTNAEAS